MGKGEELKEIFSIPVQITERNNKPCIELRKVTTDFDVIKTILTCASKEIPITIMPVFTDRLQSIDSMLDKGIIYKDDFGNFQFTI